MKRETTRVLLVDNSENGYHLTRKLLSEITDSEHVLNWVTTPETAMTITRRDQHDVYLIALRLGRSNGLDLLRSLRQMGSRTPAIILVSKEDNGVALEAMDAGAADYIFTSEIDAAQLERSIRYSVERGRAEEERIELMHRRRQYQRMKAICQETGQILHEFNNLLTAILCHSEMGVATSPVGSSMRTHFEEIQESADQAVILASELYSHLRSQITKEDLISTSELVMGTCGPLHDPVDDFVETAVTA